MKNKKEESRFSHPWCFLLSMIRGIQTMMSRTSSIRWSHHSRGCT
ncbi:MAG: hypothetical protein ACTSRH_17115 [Promethearchaeota archaeon]